MHEKFSFLRTNGVTPKEELQSKYLILENSLFGRNMLFIRLLGFKLVLRYFITLVILFLFLLLKFNQNWLDLKNTKECPLWGKVLINISLMFNFEMF